MLSPEEYAGHAPKSLGAICAVLTVVGAIVGLATPSCQAQGSKGQNTASVQLTPQQMQDAFRAKLRGHGKLSPKIRNPHTANSTMINVLRGQRQAADAERQQILASQKVLADGSVRPPALATDARAASAPGSPRQPNAGTPGKVIAPNPPVNVAISPPCVQSALTVNGKPSGVLFTPIAEWNLYTIKGCGFGNKPGKIYLEGPFTAGRIALQVPLSQERGHSNWSDRAIIANLDPQLSGEMDQENTTLVIEPAAGAPIRKSGFKFYAARETVLLRSIPESVARLANKAHSKPSNGSASVPGQEYLDYVSPSQLTPGMSVDVYRSIMNADMPPGRSDTFDFSNLTKGFEADDVQLQTYEDVSDLSCGAYDDSAWNVQWDGDNIRVNFRLSLCSVSIAESGWTTVGAAYSLNVWVIGPRGADPGPNVRGLKTMGPH